VSSIRGKQVVMMTDETVHDGAPSGFRRLARPVFEFIELETAGALTLIVAAAVALAWANSPWSDLYRRVWRTELTLSLAGFALQGSLANGINDGLMAVFFLLVGLEIKRELFVGRLSSIRNAALPAAAALGGMIVPALVYAAFNATDGNAARGWGVPMATDIAFSLGVLGLLGAHRVPVALKVFLTALAIIDDLGSVLIIAIFYRAHLSWPALAVTAATFALLLVFNRLGVRRLAPYGAIGLVLWLAVLKSGVHPTVAGVLLALTVPLRGNVASPGTLPRLESASCGQTQTPLHRLERSLHPWVSFFILPLFALANAGLATHGPDFLVQLASPVSLGTIAGLFLGKPAGILGACWLATRLGLAAPPASANWRQLHAVACLGGIGFTMSLFISNLAFPGHPELGEQAKAGIMAGSLASAITGLGLCWLAARRTGRSCHKP
jgi:NhaA family Na+:H+ antiporter